MLTEIIDCTPSKSQHKFTYALILTLEIEFLLFIRFIHQKKNLCLSLQIFHNSFLQSIISQNGFIYRRVYTFRSPLMKSMGGWRRLLAGYGATEEKRDDDAEHGDGQCRQEDVMGSCGYRFGDFGQLRRIGGAMQVFLHAARQDADGDRRSNCPHDLLQRIHDCCAMRV